MRKLKNPKSHWKKKAWTAFSAMIRKRGANHHGFVNCVTCAKIGHWKEMQAGHFIAGRNNTVLFDERLVHPQCYYCNGPLKGNVVNYFIYMKSIGYIDSDLIEFDKLKHQIKPMKSQDYQDIFNKYKAWLM